jgi:DNA-binding transcriptional ArsR family regulator
MLQPLFGSLAKERILLYLLTHGEAYPREMAAALGHGLLSVQRQLARLEDGGVVFSRLRGTVRLYALSPRYPFRHELGALLRRALEFLPAAEREALFLPRRRPRRAGKA